MAARAARLRFVSPPGAVRARAAEDNPACAQYREPMAYNACLAQHGPKANGVGRIQARPSRNAPHGVGPMKPSRVPKRPVSAAGRMPSASMGASTWNLTSGERCLKPASAAPGPAEKRRRRAQRPARWEISAGAPRLRPAPERDDAEWQFLGRTPFLACPGNDAARPDRSARLSGDPHRSSAPARTRLAVIPVTLRYGRREGVDWGQIGKLEGRLPKELERPLQRRLTLRPRSVTVRTNHLRMR